MTTWTHVSPFPVSSQSPLPVGPTTGRIAELRLGWTTGARADFHWLHEVNGGVLDADFGARLDLRALYEVRLRLRGKFQTEVSVDEDGWRRLVIHKAGAPGPWIAAQVRQTNSGTTDDSGASEPLIAKMLGITEPAGRLQSGLECIGRFHELPACVHDWVRDAYGVIRSEDDLRALRVQIGDAVALRDRILSTICETIGSRTTADLAGRMQRADDGTPILDASFAPDEDGLSLFRLCCDGDLVHEFLKSVHVRPRDCLYRDYTSATPVVELHMPFLERKWWNKRLSLFRQMRPVVSGDGRVSVLYATAESVVETHDEYQGVLMLTGSLFQRPERDAETFTLRASDRRVLPAAHAVATLPALLERYEFPIEARKVVARIVGSASEIHAGWSFQIPGSLTAAWLEAPGERSIAFYEAFTRVSSAVQQWLRLWLPYTYFRDSSRYEDLEMALPLVVYQASKPYSRRARSEFTYDPMTPRSVSLAFSHAGRRLGAVLESVHGRLLQEGKEDLATFYKPSRAKKIIATARRGPRRFKNLLAADADLVRNLVSLANRGRELRANLETEPELATKKISHFVESFVRSCQVRLRGLPGIADCPGFSSMLFVEATRALSGAYGREAPIEAVLRIQVPGQEGEHTFVNHGYRAGC